MKKEKKRVIPEEEDEETETMDIYDKDQLDEMLENDEITEAEYSFMLGREVNKKKLGLDRKEHQDSHAGELAKAEYEDD